VTIVRDGSHRLVVVKVAMRSKILSLLLAPVAVLSHYVFPNLIVNGKSTGEWEYIRMTTNHYSNGPVEDPMSPQIRCYEDRTRKPAGIFPIQAGQNVTFKSSNTMGHPGPVLFYMAKAPGGNIDRWDGSGQVWFKISESGATTDNTGVKFKTNMDRISTKIPASTPAGDYLGKLIN
jgi:hypothetical protein